MLPSEEMVCVDNPRTKHMLKKKSVMNVNNSFYKW